MTMPPVGLLPGCPAGLPGQPVDDAANAAQQGLALVMGYQQEALSLWRPLGKETPLCVSFTDGKQGYRLSQERVRHERLIKALGKPRNECHAVLDGTAGLGRDAALMAQAGFDVTLVERSPLVHALLADGLRRAPAALAARMRLLPCQDSQQVPAGEWHAVYLDPMFPARDKSAAVKKDLSWLQLLCAYPSQQEEADLMAWACSLRPHRVVVKRPGKSPPLADREAGFSQSGKAVRFDVYPLG